MLMALTPSQISRTSVVCIESSLAVNSNDKFDVSMLSVSFTGVEQRKSFLKFGKYYMKKIVIEFDFQMIEFS